MRKSKTPNFGSLIEEVLKKLAPHQRVCKWANQHKYCEKEFELTVEDIEFLKIFQVPPPNYCPTCRRIRHLVHSGTFQFFQVNCQAPDHSEKIISIFSKECPFPIYDWKYFISDKFEPFSFGKKYQDTESPLENLLELRKNFPVPSFINRDPSCINSEYSNGGRNSKNGYYAFANYNSENIWYSDMIVKSKEIMDSRNMVNSDHVYRGHSSQNIYNSSFIYFSKNCTDSSFLFDCKNCDFCFGCVNLRNAKYYVFNQPVSPENYQAFMNSIFPLTRKTLKEQEEKFWKLVKSLPMNASRNIATENVSGVMLNNTRNVFDVCHAENTENVRHSDGAMGVKDAMNIMYSGSSQLLYETTNVGSSSSNVKFSVYSKFSTESEFIFHCKNVHDCFMCFGLQNKSYCVLNVQYSPEEYFALVDKIKCQMMQMGEYGDGFGMEFSAQAYNFSLGNISFPLEMEEVLKLGGYIALTPENNVNNTEILSSNKLPQTIQEISDEIINKIISLGIKCEITGRPFRVIASEIEFLKKMKLPLPNTHPTIRMQSNLLLTPVAKKYSTHCAKCSKSIESVFDPQKKFLLYCEKCYQQEVY
jgi:hypothetical protein